MPKIIRPLPALTSALTATLLLAAPAAHAAAPNPSAPGPQLVQVQASGDTAQTAQPGTPAAGSTLPEATPETGASPDATSTPVAGAEPVTARQPFPWGLLGLLGLFGLLGRSKPVAYTPEPRTPDPH